jgi:hypothetical protein
LGAGADEIIVIEAMAGCRDRMEGGELAAEVAPRRGIQRTQLEPFQGDPAGAICCGIGSEELRHADVGSEHRQAAGFGDEQGGLRAMSGFDEDAAPISQSQLLRMMNAAATHRTRN